MLQLLVHIPLQLLRLVRQLLVADGRAAGAQNRLRLLRPPPRHPVQVVTTVPRLRPHMVVLLKLLRPVGQGIQMTIDWAGWGAWVTILVRTVLEWPLEG